jgi:tetratricopeptide (TPR) repeat protein
MLAMDSPSNMLEDFNEAIPLTPDNVSPTPIGAISASIPSNTTRADEDYSEALRLDPGYGPTIAGRGVAHLRTGRFREALPDLDIAARLTPGARGIIWSIS